MKNIVINRVVNKLSQGVRNESASRARVGCSDTSSQTGYVNISPCSQPTGGRAGARIREGRPIADKGAYFRAWRNAVWGGNFDPIAVAVDEAVSAFSSSRSEADRQTDRSLWLKIANRIGLDAFLDAFDQKRSEMANSRRRLRNPAASFQKLLNRRFPKDGGAR